MLVGGLLIQVGVTMKNTLENLKIEKKEIELIGKGSFILGWVVVAYSIIISNKGGIQFNMKSLFAIIGAIGIVMAVFHVKMSKKEGKIPNKIISMMFPIGWILTGMSIIMRRERNSWLAGLGTALILGSMIFVIPKQRELCLVDGPGYNMFSIAWWLLAIANN